MAQRIGAVLGISLDALLPADGPAQHIRLGGSRR
jgi:hypothetical protein